MADEVNNNDYYYYLLVLNEISSNLIILYTKIKNLLEILLKIRKIDIVQRYKINI